MTVTRRKRTDGRVAFVTTPGIIRAANFPIEIIGIDDAPIANTPFSITLSDGSKKSVKTDDSGLVTIARRSDKFSLNSDITSEDGSTGEKKFFRYRMETE